ncbi:hypothetical protein HN014_04440 [Aquimarina sp. TRL1]|uniref:hypothetical protein n=1 Tax=Aquimarina sp. (strain TRL1) TaxID=2736252 RepID=UPI00158CFAE9|nr:hypothetical protein [Aquimarina sp. TRL1]QKX04187.1 hypothetical protein HN014_04440 [Aquimarina sp. TRL1]
MIINYSISFQALDRFVFRFNNDQEAIGKKVRQSMIATAKEVIKIYGVSLVKSNKVSPIDPCNLPSLRTNNIQLAKITQASGRTIQRHIDRLLDCGILTKKIWHGSHSSYELFINPKILWIKGVGSVDKIQNREKDVENLSIENQVIKNDKLTKCPHSYTNKKTNKRNNRIIAVEKLQESWEVSLDEGLSSTQKTTHKRAKKPEERSSLPLTVDDRTEKKAKKETEKTRRKDLFEEKARRKDAWRGKTGLDEKTAQGRQTSAEKVSIGANRKGTAPFCDASRHAFLSKYVHELWGLAKEVLYKDVWLNKRQSNLALTLLYQWYEPVSDEKMDYVHQVYKTRIYIARDYVDRDPDHRFIKLPYEYFNPKSKGGFAGTKPWYEADKRHKKGLKLKKVLGEQVRKFRNNEKKDTAQARPRLTVFRECEQRIGKLGIPELLSKFYAAVLNPELKEY